jgi:predicted HicB family RNase H-like nuclease
MRQLAATVDSFLRPGRAVGKTNAGNQVAKRAKANRTTARKRPAEDRRTKQVMVRVTPEEKRLLTLGAAEQGDSLSNWLRKLAIRAVKQMRLTHR